MISRRTLCLGTAASLSSVSLFPFQTLAAVGSSTAQIEIKGGTLQYDAIKKLWKVQAKDILIGGLPVPVSSWGWIGITIATGVLSAVGGLIVSLISSALLGSSQPDISLLLQQQLDAFTKIVVEVARQSLVAQARGHLLSDIQLLLEYKEKS